MTAGLQTELFIAVAAAAGMAVVFVLLGLSLDLARWRAKRRTDRILGLLAQVLLGDEASAGRAAERLGRHRPSTVIPLVQRLAADLTGDAVERLRSLASSSALDRHIRARVTSRRWRRRAQGAGLANLLPDGDPARTILLDDPHPLVRARGAESLAAADAGACADRLVDLLDDDVDAGKFAAQGALIHAGSLAVDALARYLETGSDDGIRWALEVAANTPDPDLIPGIRRHLDGPDPDRRAIATRAVAIWTDGTQELRDRLDDHDPNVRAAAADAVALAGAEELAAHVGRLLGDRSWVVRERAGRSLAAMGPAGVMTLRVHLDDDDAYARDMARQVLDTLGVAHRDVGART
ncbi:MAG: HEAT repeat domain-containing protein [Actinomycetota bacterium]